MRKYFILISLIALVCAGGKAQQVYTLDDFHAMALAANKGLKVQDEKVQETDDLRKLVLTEFFPKFTANGIYHWNQKSVSILSDSQKEKLSSLGDRVEDKIDQRITGPVSSWLWNRAIDPAVTPFFSDLNAAGQQVVEDFDLNTHHVFVGAVTMTQPVYLGGKIRAAYRMAQLSNELAGIEYDKAKEDLLVTVDEAFWRVVSLEHKVQLAQQYCRLLEELSSNVDAMVESEVATTADQAKVRVKLNEAQMNLAKATNGLALSKMLLAQLGGLDIHADYSVSDRIELQGLQPADEIDMRQVWSNRSEMKMLRIAEDLAAQGSKLATSTFLPNVMLTASYLWGTPSFYNGLSNKPEGMFTVGLVANIPLLHPDAFYSVKIARHKRNEIAYQIDEAKAKIELQVNKLNYELEVALRKLTQAQSNLTYAEENLKLAQESFAAGVASSSDLMAAQTAWMSAKSEVLDTEIEVRLGYRTLCQALGAGQRQ